MTRRKFIKTSGASALVTAGTTGGALAGNAAQTKGKKSKKKVSTDRAPNAIRTPISRVRSETEQAITP